MSGRRTSVEMVKVMKLVRGGMTGYAAAKRVGIALSTLYRSVLWKEYQAELAAQPKQENQHADS
jgi:transposase